MATKDQGTSKPKSSDRRWHAVSVKPSPRACNAAVSGKNRRWLSKEAPMLPLPGCTQPDSRHCTYQHHDDRRGVGGRRAEDMDAFARPPQVANERRKRGSRRTSDQD